MAVPNDVKKCIHKWAVLGAATVAVLPIGADAAALCGEEALMIIQVGAKLGVSINKSAAQGIIAALIAQGVGQAAAIAALEAANATFPLSFVIKAGIASGIIEAMGLAAYEYFKANQCSKV